ncbi:hypothetical protein BCAH1134_C0424 (plasmid) [Bacillus cereus AH1134]|nr:hypothetical protein BCAH1134_C0424 [Bacillus cereus AH1134]
MLYLNKGEVFKKTPPFQCSMNFNNYLLISKHCFLFTYPFTLFVTLQHSHKWHIDSSLL